MSETYYINGDLYTARHPQAAAMATDAERSAVVQADIVAAVSATQAAISDQPIPDQYTTVISQLVWLKWVTLRPEQLDALIDIQVRADRVDASELSILTQLPVSDIKRRINKAKKAIEAMQQEVAQ